MSLSPLMYQRLSELEAQHHQLDAIYHQIKASYYQLQILDDQIWDAVLNIENDVIEGKGTIEEREQELEELATMGENLEDYLEELTVEITRLDEVKRATQAHIRDLQQIVQSFED